MKKLLLFAATIAFLNAGAAFADLKVGVVDLNKVIANDPHMTKAQADLKKQFEPRSQKLNVLQKSFQADVDQYNKDQSAGTLKNASLKTAQQKLIDNNKKVQEARDGFQRDLVNAQNQSMQSILKRIESTVHKIAVDKKYDLVITKMSAAYSKPEFDITDQVISAVKK